MNFADKTVKEGYFDHNVYKGKRKPSKRPSPLSSSFDFAKRYDPNQNGGGGSTTKRRTTN
jgi:hypothetical protein